MRSEGRLQRWGAALAIAFAGGLARAEPSATTPPATPPVPTVVEAAYLPKFAPFVVWPPQALGAADAPLVICVQGADPFGDALDRASAGQRLGSHPIVVRRIEALDADSGCQIAYVGGSAAQPAAAALKAVAQAPVLTVTDEGSRGGGKGIVQLFWMNGRVRFAIDGDMAAKAGLAISSQLMALGTGPQP